jgi:arylsulfatase A-like enzyme
MKAQKNSFHFGHYFRFICFSLPFLILFPACRKRESGIYRLADHLAKESVVVSPLKDIAVPFPRLSQSCPGGNLKEVALNSRKYWALFTSTPLLSPSDNEEPFEAEVFFNKKKIPYSQEPFKDTWSWRWIKGEKRVDFQPSEGLSPTGGLFALPMGKTFETTLLLPPGVAAIELAAESAEPFSYRPCLEIEVNGQKSQEIILDDSRIFKWTAQTRLGENRIRIAFRRVIAVSRQAKQPEGETALLRYLKFMVLGDVILLSAPPNVSKPEGQIEIRYVPEPPNATANPGRAAKPDYLPLFHLEYYLREYEVHDFDVEHNPYSIQKKLKIEGESYNTLFALPPTELRFDVRVPARAVLNFGYGIYRKERDVKSHVVSFEILMKDSKGTKTIFQSSIAPDLQTKNKKNLVREQKLDISAYQDKNVTLIFRTRGSAGPHRQGPLERISKDGLVFWINPFIGQKSLPLSSPQARPNIILISIDTLRADYLGCYGQTLPTSPAIDELASGSALFLTAFSQAPYTLSSHITMFTGLNPTTHQVFYPNETLNPGTQTLTQVLRSHGYYAAAFTGGTQVSSLYGFSRGFDIYGETAGANYLINSAEVLFHKAAAWLRANKDYKFFLFLHTYQPHNPYRTPPFPGRESFLKKDFPWRAVNLQSLLGQGLPRLFNSLTTLERENVIALYKIEIRYTDEYFIRPLLEELKRLNLYDNTMIVLTSDHGEEFYDHSGWMHVHTLYNELLHVPLIIKFPRSRYSGRRVDGVAGVVDIMPTILEEAGISASRLRLDGKSLLSLLTGEENRERFLIGYLPAWVATDIPRRVVIFQGQHKLIMNDDYPPEAYTFFSPPPPRQEPIELYNFHDDPLEKRNLARQNPNLVQELLRKTERVLKKSNVKKKSEKFTLDKNLEEQLRALGYIR